MTDPTQPEGTDVPTRRRLRPALVTTGALALAVAAVVTGAAVSASAMPEPTPPATDSVIVSQVEVGDDGEVTGFDCTFTGEDAAAVLPPGGLPEDPGAVTVGDAEGVAETDPVEVTGAVQAPRTEPALPLPGTDGTIPQLRLGTQAECDEMLAAITGD